MLFRIITPLFLFLAPLLHSYYIGNPKDPDLIPKGFFSGPKSILSYKVSPIDDWTLDRSLYIKGGRSFKKYKNDSNGIEVTAVILERLSILGYFGYESMKGTFYSLTNDELYYETKNLYANYFGAKLLIFERKNVSLGATAKYLHSKGELRELSKNGVLVDRKSNSEVHYDESQVAIMLAYTQNFLIPYGGLFFYNVQGEFLNMPENYSSVPTLDFSNKYNTGVVAGLSVTSKEYFSINAEARLIAEMSLGFEVAIKF